jgi:hypothetical protein
MRRYLDAVTLADIVAISRGEAGWPSESDPTPGSTPPWVTGS